MDKWTRLHEAFALRTPDRPPILGGWLAAPKYIIRLTGCSEDDYWADPVTWGLAAERVLDSDGAIDVVVPASRGEYRIMDQATLDRRAEYDVDKVLACIEALPDVDEIRERFDAEQDYAEFRADYLARQAQCAPVVWCPADWKLIPKALWYHEFGYEAALMTLALYPDRYRKLIRTSAEIGRQRAAMRARMVQEGIHPRAILTGEDLCAQQGPLVSPQFLRDEYWYWVEYALEPLVQIGVRVVWHCDGNYRPLLPDVLASGIGGLQGFQRECGMDLTWIRDLRTRGGDPLLIFGAMSVTETLPYGTADDVRAEVAAIMALARDRIGLVFMTSNTITPDAPLENILAYWHAVQDSRW
jgi:hypothetical protein